jgi:hypothetical protein
MFDTRKSRLNLQIFAEGAPAGDGGAAPGAESSAATAEDPAVAGREWLKSNGATEAMITPGRAKAVGLQLQKERGTTTGADGKAEAQVAAAADAGEGSKQWALPEGTTWEQIMSIPEMNAKMQETVQKRLKGSKAAEEAMQTMAPALKLLAKHHGLEGESLDYEALAEKIMGDDSIIEAKALQMGVSTEVARQMVREEQTAAAQGRARQETFQEETMRSHYTAMVEEAKSLATVYPGFDLRTELQNPHFARLTQPAVMQALGGLKGVYEAVHREELTKQRETAAAELARQQVAADIRAGAARPSELGDGKTASPGPRTSFSGDEVRELARRAARGEKIVL